MFVTAESWASAKLRRKRRGLARIGDPADWEGGSGKEGVASLAGVVEVVEGEGRKGG